MRKVAIVVGLVVVALGIGTLAWYWMVQSPLRTGMTEAEVEKILGEPMSVATIGPKRSALPGTAETYSQGLDWRGDDNIITVYYDFDDGRVVEWETFKIRAAKPSWLGNLAKAVGW